MSDMKNFLILVMLSASMLVCAQEPTRVQPSVLPTKVLSPGVAIPLKNASFQANAQGELSDWAGLEHNKGESYTFVADTEGAYSKPSSARIRRHGDELFGLLAQTIRVQPEWLNKKLRLSGYLKAEKVDGEGGALVLQTTGGGGNVLTHNHMDDQRVKGNQSWKAYAIEIRIPPEAYFVRLGPMLEGGGTLWADDMKLELID